MTEIVLASADDIRDCLILWGRLTAEDERRDKRLAQQQATHNKRS